MSIAASIGYHLTSMLCMYDYFSYNSALIHISLYYPCSTPTIHQLNYLHMINTISRQNKFDPIQFSSLAYAPLSRSCLFLSCLVLSCLVLSCLVCSVLVCSVLVCSVLVRSLLACSCLVSSLLSYSRPKKSFIKDGLWDSKRRSCINRSSKKHFKDK